MTEIPLPRLINTTVIGDDPLLLAQISSACARKGWYLPILDAPRSVLPNVQSQVIRLNNVVARLAPTHIILAGLTDSTCELFSNRFPKKQTYRVETIEQFRATPGDRPDRTRRAPLSWGSDKIGLGLLRAFREGREIVFDGSNIDPDPVRSDSNHVVVCEEGDYHAQVVAANYAHSLGAGLQLIREVPAEEADSILDEFYLLYDSPEPPTTTLQRLKERIRQHVGELKVPTGGSVTFITRRVPFGFAFHEYPSTHLFGYPNLGISISNGIIHEQRGSPGIHVAVFIDPGTVVAEEIRVAVQNLRSRESFLRGLHASGATASSVNLTLELFPYDLLLISTHCGDAPGIRHTYEFTDTEGIFRTLTVDLAVGVAARPGDELVDVTLFYSFVSLDGIPWNDQERKSKHYVGRAIVDFIEFDRGGSSLTPTRSEPVARVPRSSALRLYDGNYIPVPRSLASERSPIVINNACASWHRLAITFTVANARAYLGTLFSITEVEAQEFISLLFTRFFGRPLSVAIWHAHNSLYGNSVRRPYVLVGCHFQRLRVTASEAPVEILEEMERALSAWKRKLSKPGELNESQVRTATEYVRYLEEQIGRIEKRWLAP